MQPILFNSFNIALLLLSALVLVVDRSIGAVALLMLLVSVAMLLKGRHSRVPLGQDEKLFLWGMCVYPLAVVIGMIGHGNGDLASFDHASRFLLVLPIFFAVRRFGASRSLFYTGLMLGAIGAGCFGYYQKYIQELYVANGYIHKISFGNISLMLGVLSLTYCIKPQPDQIRNKWIMALAVIAFGFGVMGSITSGTRGGWIGVPLMLWLILREAISYKPLRFGLYALFIGGALTLYSSNELVQRKVDMAVQDTTSYFSAEKQVQGSASTRFEMWRAAAMMFAENPLLGVGAGEYRQALQELMAKEKIQLPTHWGHAHNEFLHALAEKGVFGGLSVLALYGLLLHFFLKHRQKDYQIAAAGLLLTFGFIDFGLTQAMFKHNITTIFLAIYAAVLAGWLCHIRNLHESRSSHAQQSVN